MYVYFDKNGVLREIVNDEGIRQGSNDVNKIYIYVDTNIIFSHAWWVERKSDGTTTLEKDFITNIVYKEIPYEKNRDLKYFKDYKTYKFYTITLENADLDVAGLALVTVRFITQDDEIFAQGLITFNIEDSVIKADHEITQSQYDYLLTLFSGYLTGATLDGISIVEDSVVKILSSDIVLSDTQVRSVLEETGTIGISINDGKIEFTVKPSVLDRITANEQNITNLQNNKLNKNLSDLNITTEIGNDDLIIINKGGTSYKVLARELKEKDDHYLGNYQSVSALETAHPTAIAGDYAFVETIDEEDPDNTILIMYIWDNVDSEWQETSSTNYVDTATFQAFQNALQDGTFVVNKSDKVGYNGGYDTVDNITTTLLGGNTSFSGYYFTTSWRNNSSASTVIQRIKNAMKTVTQSGETIYLPFNLSNFKLESNSASRNNVMTARCVGIGKRDESDTYNSYLFEGFDEQENHYYFSFSADASNPSYLWFKYEPRTTAPDELFKATYGTTTYAEITTALSNNQIPICVYNGVVYNYAGIESQAGVQEHIFKTIDGWNNVKKLRVNSSDTWNTGVLPLQIENITTTISSSSTNGQYPSAKAVYDNLATKSTVSVSDTGTSTDEVNYITINGTEKKLAGGTQVEANPVGSATNDLNKVDIEGTIYQVKQFNLTDTTYLASVVFNYADSSSETVECNYSIVGSNIYLTNVE